MFEVLNGQPDDVEERLGAADDAVQVKRLARKRWAREAYRKAKVGDAVPVDVEAIIADDWLPEVVRDGIVEQLHEDGSADIVIHDTVRAEWDSDCGWTAVEKY